jgi:hypothetical protein
LHPRVERAKRVRVPEHSATRVAPRTSEFGPRHAARTDGRELQSHRGWPTMLSLGADSQDEVEILMRLSIYTAAASLAVLITVGQAAAMPVDRLTPAAVPTNVEQAQFFFGGRNYCWYGNGWQGPGYYWCGYAWRRGFGWGGGAGWHGWDHRRPPGPRPGFGRPPGPRPGAGRPPGGRPGGGGGRPPLHR